MIKRSVIQHPDESKFDEFLFKRLAEPELKHFEEHLFICEECRKRLDGISLLKVALMLAESKPESRRVRFSHQTEDGLIICEVNALAHGEWLARHFGPQLAGGTVKTTMNAAIDWLNSSFTAMFPDHVCTEKCLSNSAPNR